MSGWIQAAMQQNTIRVLGIYNFAIKIVYQTTIITNKQTRFVKLVLIGQKILGNSEFGMCFP